MTDELLDALVISGSAESITEKLARRASVDEVFATHIPGPDPDAEMDVLLAAPGRRGRPSLTAAARARAARAPGGGGD